MATEYLVVDLMLHFALKRNHSNRVLQYTIMYTWRNWGYPTYDSATYQSGPQTSFFHADEQTLV